MKVFSIFWPMGHSSEHTNEIEPFLEQVRETIGLDVASKLAKSFGGIRVHIPANPSFRSPVSKVVGIEAAQAIAKLIGRGVYYIPMPVTKYARRIDAVEALILAGRSTSEIARELDCSERSIYTARARLADLGRLKPGNAVPQDRAA